MHNLTPRSGARPKVAPLTLSLMVALTLAAGTACSGSSSPRAAATAPSPSATATPTADAAAMAALARAQTVVLATRSFSFAATEVLSGSSSHATSVRGSVVRGQGVTYVLTANGRTSQVVRIAGATYVRQVPGKWSKLLKPRPVNDPASSLLAVLRGLTDVSLQTVGTTQVVSGSLPPAAAKAAQLPAESTPAHVGVTLDANGHVTKLVIATQSGTTALMLTTSYGSFGRVKPLKAPV
jgi:hypothetical protein